VAKIKGVMNFWKEIAINRIVSEGIIHDCKFGKKGTNYGVLTILIISMIEKFQNGNEYIQAFNKVKGTLKCTCGFP